MLYMFIVMIMLKFMLKGCLLDQNFERYEVYNRLLG